MNKIKFEIEIDPQPILDNLYSEGNPQNGLAKGVEREIRSEAIRRIVEEIRSQNVPYSYNSDWFAETIKNEIIKRIEKQINTLIENWYNEKKLQNFIERRIENIMEDWIDNKVMKCLEAAKGDIVFYKQQDIQEMEEEHQRELAEASEKQNF